MKVQNKEIDVPGAPSGNRRRSYGGASGVKYATARTVVENQATYEKYASGKTKTKTTKTRPTTEKLKIGTWNVRSMKICGKLENLKLEMKRNEVDILGISETRWENNNDIWSNDYRILNSGQKNGRNGVGIILNKKKMGQ